MPAPTPKSILNYFHPRSVPPLCRHSYRWEVVTASTYPLALSLLEIGVIAMLARKAFDVPPTLYAAIMAAPMFANLTSTVWSRLARGRSKIQFIVVLKIILILALGAIALLPTNYFGAFGLAALVIFCRCLICGFVTTRATVWRMNYPRTARGQVTARLEVLAFLIMALVQIGAAALLDYNEQSFRVFYPAAAAAGLIGVWAYSHLRIRSERSLLRQEGRWAGGPDLPVERYLPDRIKPVGRLARLDQRVSDADASAAAENRPAYADTQTGSRDTFWSILRHDAAFRQYMIWQYVAGMAFMSSEVVSLLVIDSLTSGISLEYFIAIALGAIIPLLMETFMVPVWARVLDNHHITSYRTRQGAFWITIQLLYFAAALLTTATFAHSAVVAMVILFLARILVGIVRAGGRLAWQLGHNDFAGRANNHTYMTIHATLTGIRGATAPFIAVFLFTGWAATTIPGTNLTLPGFDGIGGYVFLITLALALIGTAGFAHMALQRPSKSQD